MALQCWVQCTCCRERIPVGGNLAHGKRYHTSCRRCGANIIFGLRSLRWHYEPTTMKAMVAGHHRYRWRGSGINTTPFRKRRSVS